MYIVCRAEDAICKVIVRVCESLMREEGVRVVIKAGIGKQRLESCVLWL